MKQYFLSFLLAFGLVVAAGAASAGSLPAGPKDMKISIGQFSSQSIYRSGKMLVGFRITSVKGSVHGYAENAGRVLWDDAVYPGLTIRFTPPSGSVFIWRGRFTNGRNVYDHGAVQYEYVYE